MNRHLSRFALCFTHQTAILISVLGLISALAETSGSGSSSTPMDYAKIEDSEDLSETALKELRGDDVNQSETASTDNQQITPAPKPDIIIIRPPTLEERARIEREEIELEKAKKILRKSGRAVKRSESGQVGQGTLSDTTGVGAGGGGGDSGENVHEQGEWSVIKPPCLEDRAKMEMEEIRLAKEKGKGPGQGGGEGGGSGEGSGVEAGAEKGADVPISRSIKKICKSKNIYECMAEEAKDRELQEKASEATANGNEGDNGNMDVSSGETEVKYKRPAVRFKTRQELEAEAQIIMNEKDQPTMGESSSSTDQVLPESSVSVRGPTLQEKAKEIQSEINAIKRSQEVGSGGEKPSPPTQDLE